VTASDAAPASSPTADPLSSPGADPGWARLHPLTPLLRGGRFGLALLAVAGQQGLRQESPLAVLVILLLGMAAAVLFGWVSWRAMRYRVTTSELQIDSGVLTRRSRRVPLARVQSVDVVRPLYARVLGLAELRLEVAGGGKTEAPLSYLDEDSARRLRGRLLDLAAGRTIADRSDEPAPDAVLVVVPVRPLVASTLLGAPLITLVLLLAGLAAAVVVDAAVVGPALFAVVPALLGVGSFAVRRILTEYGFSVAESPDGLRLRHGLLDTRSQTIPPGRVQLVRVREPLLWRPFGWVRVEVDVAGYAADRGEEQAATSALLPVAPRALATALVARVLGAPLPDPDRPAPPAARLRSPLSFPRLGYGLDEQHLVSRYGLVTSSTDVVPLAKVQNLRLTQGPWQRRLDLTSLHVDTAGRRLPGTVVGHRGGGEGAALLAELATRTRQARRPR